MTTILGIELRRSSAPVAGLLIAVPGAAGLYLLAANDQSELWDGQWSQLAVFARIMLVILWPLALAAGAWQAGRDRRGGMDELLGTTPAPSWRRRRPAAVALASCLALGYLLVLAAGAPVVARSAGYSGGGWPAVTLVGVLALLAAGGLGLGIGRLLPRVYTPPVLGVGGLVVLLTAVEAGKGTDGVTSSLLLFTPNFTTTISEFQSVATPVSTGQALWFTGLAAGGLLLFLAPGRVARLLALLPPVLGLVIAAPLLTGAPEEAFPAYRPAAAEVCTDDDGPRVCVTAAHRKDLPALVDPARDALRLLAQLPDPPTSVHEVVPDRGHPQPANEVWLAADSSWERYGSDELTVRLLAGGGTRLCAEGGPYVETLRARAVAAAWLYGSYPAPGQAVGDRSEHALRTTAWRTFTAVGAQEQQRRVAAVRTAGLSCGDQSAALTSVGAR